MLPAKKDDLVLEKRLVDCIPRRGIEWLRQVDAAHLGAKTAQLGDDFHDALPVKMPRRNDRIIVSFARIGVTRGTRYVMNDSPPDLPESADVVIIGAGIAGISAAWFLHQAGLRVTVCEKGVVAGEQSGRNWGWIRQQGRDQAELPIMIESMRLWQDIADAVDIDIGYRRNGSLYLSENDAELARHERFMSFAPAYGLSTEYVNRARLEELITDCPRRWQSGLYTPDDGRAEPSLAVPAMARALAAQGVQIIEQCAVERVLTQNRQVSGVLTELGEINTATVLCAGGGLDDVFTGNLRRPPAAADGQGQRRAHRPGAPDIRRQRVGQQRVFPPQTRRRLLGCLVGLSRGVSVVEPSRLCPRFHAVG